MTISRSKRGTVTFSRGSFLSAAAGLMVGALIVMAAPSPAAEGDAMILGERNLSRTVTKLTTRGGLRIDNFKSGNPALILNVEGSAPPLQVNSTGFVDNLNADKLDFRDARDLQALTDECHTDDAPNGSDYSCIVTIYAQVPGTLVGTGGISATYSGPTSDILVCRLYLDQNRVHHSDGVLSPAAGQGHHRNSCTTNASIEVGAGAWKVGFRIEGADEDTRLGAASLDVIFIPSL
jgi:hypothetical protein